MESEAGSEAGSQAAEKKDEGPPWWKVEVIFSFSTSNNAWHLAVSKLNLCFIYMDEMKYTQLSKHNFSAETSSNGLHSLSSQLVRILYVVGVHVLCLLENWAVSGCSGRRLTIHFICYLLIFIYYHTMF